MNAYVKQLMRVTACLTLLVGIFAATAWADKWLTVNLDGNSDGDVVMLKEGPDGDAIELTASGEHAVDNYAEVTLTAVPGSASQFDYWSGDASGSDPITVVEMENAAREVTAHFTTVAGDSPQLTLTLAGEGSGTVTLVGANGHSYTATESGSFEFDLNEVVTLTAFPADGNVFDGWSGVLSGATNPETLTMSEARAVTATFSVPETPQGEVKLSLTFSGEGGGGVSMIGSQGNNCTLDAGGYCFFYSDERVTLRANADIGSEFDGWTGDLSGSDITITAVLTENTECDAAFAVAEETTVPGCGTSKYTNYSSGFDATHFALNNVAVVPSGDDTNIGYLRLQTGDDAIDPNNIIIPFEQQVSVTFLYEGGDYDETDFGWMLAADGVDGTKTQVYENINDDDPKNGVLDDAETDSNGDGVTDARDNRRVLGTFAAGTELVFYLKVDNESKTFYTKTDSAWNPDNWNGKCSGDGPFTKTYHLGRALTSEGSCQQDSNWMTQDALDRLDELFGLDFADDDTTSMVIERNSPFSHVIAGAPGDKPNEWVLGWEDLGGGGDTDHNDVVFQIERRTGGVAQLQSAQAIQPDETGAYYTAVLFEVYDNMPCSGRADINYYLSVDNGANWVEITEWDTIKAYSLDDDGEKVLGDDVSYWSAGCPQYTYRARRVDFSGLGLIGRQLIWKAVLSSQDEACVAEIRDVNLTGSVATHADISRASPVVQANVLYTGSYETPAASWTSTNLRGHLRAVRTYGPLNTNLTDNVELWDAGAVLTAASPASRTIYYPNIALTVVTDEALGTGDGTTGDFSGTLAHHPVLAESVRITVGTETFTDKHTEVLEGSLGGSGTINRFTGAWEITPHEIPTENLPITADYSWYSTSSTLRSFTTANVNSTQLALDKTYVHGTGYRYDFNNNNVYPDYSDAALEADADWLVNWVRGYADGSSTKKEWLLDPIDHSVPAVVTPPGRPSWYYGTDISSTERSTYDTFVTNKAARDTIVLVGSRSGMLHAFDAGQFRWGDNAQTPDTENRGYFLWDDASAVTSWWTTFLSDYADTDPESEAPFFTWQTKGSKAPDYGDGSEKWAFIPANLLPRLKNNYLKAEDRAYVDASPAVCDVYVNSAWKTVALCAEGNGGDTVFALDVTNTASPKFMWEFADPDLFRSRSSPAVAVLGRIVAGGQTKWAAFFVSGETYDDALYPSIYVINIADGSVIRRIFLNCNSAGAGGVPSGQPAIVDSDGNGYIDRLYIGTDKGFMYKVNIPDRPNSVAYEISQCIINTDYDYVQVDDKDTPDDTSDDVSTTYSIPASQRGHAIYASPTVVVDNSLDASGQLQYNVRIFYGTGDSPYADEDVNTDNTTYHFFAYVDHEEKGSTSTSDIELSWFQALPAGHRVFASAFAAAGNIYFGTATSDTEDPCDGTNEGRIYGFTYSGLSVISDEDGNKGLEVGDVTTTPLVEDEHLYIKTRDGLKSFGASEYNHETRVGGLPYTRVRFWREIF